MGYVHAGAQYKYCRRSLLQEVGGGKGRFLGDQSKVSCIDYCALPSAQGPDQLMAQISFGPRPALSFLTAEILDPPLTPGGTSRRNSPARPPARPPARCPGTCVDGPYQCSRTETMTIDGGCITVTIYHELLMCALEFQTLNCVIRTPLPPHKRLQREQHCSPAHFITSFPRFR